MKHLRRIFESNDDKIKDMAKIVFEYIRDFENTDLLYNIDSIIRNAVDFDDLGEDEYHDDPLTMDEIIEGITNIVNGYSTERRRYNEFIDFFHEVEIESQHNHELEVIDDLFLNSGYKYNVKKSVGDDTPVFKVEIEEIQKKDILKVTTHIWNVVSRRLPDSLFISHLAFHRRKKDSNSYIEITISDGNWSNVEEDEDF